MRALLACDPGGTKCDALLLAEDGRVLGTGSHSERGVGGRNHQAVLAACLQALKAGGQEFKELHIVCPRDQLPDEVFDQIRADWVGLYGIPEHEAALATVGERHGFVLLAGTGAFVYCRTRDGRETKYDGLGPVLGDEGSGFHVGMLALRAAIKAEYHARHATMLRAMIFEQYNVKINYQLIFLNLFARDRSEIASFARMANEAAEAGDPIAQQVLREAAGAIFSNLRDLAEAFQLVDQEYTVVGVGSVALKIRQYWDEIVRLGHEQLPRFRFIQVPFPPVVGVAHCGLRLAGFSPESRANLLTIAKDLYKKL